MREVAWIAAAAFLAGTPAIMLTQNPVWLGIALAAGFLVRARLYGSLSRAIRSALPILVFSSTIMLLEYWKQSSVSLLGLKAATVFVLVTAAVRLLPHVDLATRFEPRTRSYSLMLFILFTRHFVTILHQESLRLLRARSLCISRPCGRGALRSLGAALSSLFNRSLARTERFYAGQLLRGFGE